MLLRLSSCHQLPHAHLQYLPKVKSRPASKTTLLLSPAAPMRSCRISVTFVSEKDGSEKTVQVPIGQHLLEAAHRNDIELEGACVCKVVHYAAARQGRCLPLAATAQSSSSTTEQHSSTANSSTAAAALVVRVSRGTVQKVLLMGLSQGGLC